MMDSASAANMPVREPESVGELGLLARQAMLKRMEGARAVQQFREVALQEVTPREVHAPRATARGDGPASAFAQAGASQSHGADYSASVHNRPFEVTDLFPYQRVLQDRRRTALQSMNTTPGEDAATARVDGDQLALTDIQRELRSIRSELTQLTRSLTPERLNRDLRAEIENIELRTEAAEQRRNTREIREELRSENAARDEHYEEQRRVEQAETEQMIRRQELERISQRQRDLLYALRRAETRLDDAPDDLPPGMRDSLIGQIYRARYSIAVFGGTMGSAQLSGLAFDRAA